MAQSFVQWICQDESQYKIVPVGADWTNREPLLGYPNALNNEEYVKPDNGVLDLMISAAENDKLPHFLIFDEMNLSHVERYFADFLSVMESKDEKGIKLYSDKEKKDSDGNHVPESLRLPQNLFIIGTVNIDETTYMFSPKVLDRANAIEFRISSNEMNQYFTESPQLDMEKLRGKGASMAVDFLDKAQVKHFDAIQDDGVKTTLVKFFTELQKTGAEFGYRSASEILRLMNQLTVIDPALSFDKRLDIAIMQKLLPKLHGSRRKLLPVLEQLAKFCLKDTFSGNIEKEVLLNKEMDYTKDDVRFRISLEKIVRMYNGAIENGFASYAEA